MASGWPPTLLSNPDENNKSEGLEKDDLPKESVKAENAKAGNKCTIRPFTNLYLPLLPFNPPTSTREQKESLDKNWTKELCERLDQLIARESSSRQCSHADCDRKGGAPEDSGYTNNYDARKYWRECALFQPPLLPTILQHHSNPCYLMTRKRMRVCSIFLKSLKEKEYVYELPQDQIKNHERLKQN
ncbi:hypothetical protein AV530_008535 [Patagioenas fasciata monilis]|uniref:Uncharacterized protein n=1 Tax=Patagioenas fasciata monilis TaxID=372326 RepID=A0A1V4KCR6_PATFA|nr:hypothetical protein AV530_008535 [Patagioenas fasciata monilis]